MFRSDFAALSMIVVALAAARLGSTDLRAEQSDGTQEHWSAEKILAPEPGRKACWRRVASMTQSIWPRIRSRRSRSSLFSCAFPGLTPAATMCSKIHITLFTISPCR